jgi:dTDP-4-amino-4,6-dideoxygalactose transaminase
MLRRPKRYPVRLSNFQAFVGLHEVRDLTSNIDHRRAVARRYQELFLEKKDLSEGTYLRYSILVQNPSQWEKKLGRYFTVGRWFSSIAEGRTSDWSAIGYQPGSCPNAEFVSSHIINFPTHCHIDETAVHRLDRLVKKFELMSDILPLSCR